MCLRGEAATAGPGQVFGVTGTFGLGDNTRGWLAESSEDPLGAGIRAI